MLSKKVKVGQVNCEKYRKVCERAAVRGYPTVRFYRGGQGQQQYSSQDIQERSPSNIINLVQSLLREDSEQHQPLQDDLDLDLKKVPLGENISEDNGDTESYDEEQDSDFIYFYEDDNTFTHDEL